MIEGLTDQRFHDREANIYTEKKFHIVKVHIAAAAKAQLSMSNTDT